MAIQFQSEKIYLGVILAIGLLLGLGFWGYYATKESVKNEPEAQSPAGAPEDYRLKLRITFTSEVYPADLYQTNPRIRRYLGKVQNLGDRIVTHVNIRVSYLDKNNTSIFEQVIPISATLKPNFIQEFQFGGLEVPGDWSGKVDYEITEIRFVDSQKVDALPSVRRDPRLERPPLQQIIFPF